MQIGVFKRRRGDRSLTVAALFGAVVWGMVWAVVGGAPEVLYAEPSPQLKRLQVNIERITRSLNADWGIYMKCLETGEEIAINADQPMDTMSVIKIPLMVEALRQIDAGRFALTDRVVVKESDMRPGTGVLRSLDPGASVTIKDLLMLMIIVSDNTATDLMYEKVGGPEAVNQAMQSLGLKTIKATGTGDTWFKALRAAPSAEQFHREGKTPFGLASPREIGKLLEMMERGEAVSKSASALMLDMLRRQVYSSRLPKYVTGFRVGHKTGDFLPYIGNDVGVLESTDRKVILSVFTAHHYGLGPQLEDAIGRIAEQVSNYYGYR
ncbi:MAG: class A beta-lactamase-related serine hydrolase [Acidobacteriota bacterium]|nr:class A beta-lactamase-related serine hydrolase [Acidobacteriota bacterium]